LREGEERRKEKAKKRLLSPSLSLTYGEKETYS